ncbi:Cytochrome P450 monooxygenase aclL [Colletotrichum gloeosporioides]|uniref:Cytochrome P450 monooxygenase aclL n=1 Tax=Colletotrichum gloeosporioides TaxID=474922 RepID=A0A8H4CBK1_COLGL|nr:Cytochrome P450 monooxygenase aclL [Colletotrichum gloeosporioides]KAF3800754.1 Cytochrome P450 monooxygenase aclL [Colletotrichum gloeosporioides]
MAFIDLGTSALATFTAHLQHFLHPLRSYPGPWYSTISIAWFVYHGARGDVAFAIHELHEIYGPVVRIAPDELSYTQSEAWKDVYGPHGGTGYMEDPSQTFTKNPAHPNIMVAP